ncbi:LysR family transcriptional regulator ArgP [Marinobacterium sediminicola]|uniref:LysR family transcriptional regulator, chromosome initiation inhibitor n=1 Tax=Marinobacterium sediminicola TaxID=518898 RepID=A0ABY1RWE4_9GAMM|nr:LysR family transcriptional regulator ArgP [Marinobacterium sediminicola]ULG70339.1 LysR family transcriptional regulator ArgP [Marinobacterium sediminicola]SMR69693.1 LysR family transcriptional regulator, chromosome initiation inhibitor [Marinobacterium sediminicola]
MMIDRRQLAALAAVVEECSFERAAQRLHVTQSAVSQRIKQLEESLGQVLLVRTVPVRATEAGQQVLKHYRQLHLLEQELLQDLSQQDAQGYTRVPLGLNADSLETWFPDAVESLVLEQRLLLDLKVDDQDATHQLLRNGEVIGCITASPKAMPGCLCVPLGVVPYRCLASSAYLSRYFPEGVMAAGFMKAPVAEYSSKDQLQNRYLQQFFGLKPHEYPRHRIPSSQAFCNLIERGLACGMVPDQQGRPMMEAGRAVDMMPGCYLAVPLYWHVWNLGSRLIRQLTEALVAEAERQLEPFERHPVLTHPM